MTASRKRKRVTIRAWLGVNGDGRIQQQWHGDDKVPLLYGEIAGSVYGNLIPCEVVYTEPPKRKARR